MPEHIVLMNEKEPTHPALLLQAGATNVSVLSLIQVTDKTLFETELL
jgi:hypothetical protein